MKTSENMDQIIPALAKAQKFIGAAQKNTENKFYETLYADLGSVTAAIKSPLLDQGIFVIQSVESVIVRTGESWPFLVTRLQHESGQFIESVTPIVVKYPLPKKGRDGNETVGDYTQAFGKAVTLTRRYAIQALVFVPSVDDERTWSDNVLDHKPNNGSKKTDVEIIQEMIADHVERIEDPETMPQEKDRLTKVVGQLHEQLEAAKSKATAGGTPDNVHPFKPETPTGRTGSRQNASARVGNRVAAGKGAKAQESPSSASEEELFEQKGWKGYRLTGYQNPVFNDKPLGGFDKAHIKVLWIERGAKNGSHTDPHLAEEAAWIRLAAIDHGIISEND
jgi:hypothetical protein